MELTSKFVDAIDKYIDDRTTAGAIAEEILEVLKSMPVYDVIEELS